MRLSMGMRLGDMIRAVAGGAAASPLLTGLLSYWGLDTDWTDAVGDNDLTPSATPPTHVNRGPLGTVASLVKANTEYLTNASYLPSESPTGFTIAIWQKIAGTQTGDVAHGNWNGASGWNTYALGGSGYIPRFYSYGGGDNKYVDAFPSLPFGPWPTVVGEWRFCVYWWDGTKIGVEMDADPISTNTVTVTAGPRFDLPFSLGRTADGGGLLDGQLGPVGIWGRALSPAERASLFNSGNGKKYADLTTAEKVGLVSYWNLDEVSGNRADSHGSNTLTDNNTVLSVNSGPAGVVANFTAAAESLAGGSGDLTFGDTSFSVDGWVWVSDDAPATVPIVSKWFLNGWRVACGGGATPEIRFVVWSSGGGSGNVAVTGIAANAWHHYTAWYDAALSTVNLQVDGGSVASGASEAPTDVGQTFRIADPGNMTTGSMRVGPHGVWSSVLGATERASLFNNGRGKHYADLAGAETTGLLSWWDLTEAGGNRSDSKGSVTLTDVSTVGSVVNAGSAMNGAAASFVAASSESLSIATPVTPAAPAAWSMAGWFYVPSAVADYACLVDGGDSGADPGHWGLYKLASSGGAVLYSRVNNTMNIPITLDAWNLIYIEFDGNEPCTPGVSANGAAVTKGSASFNRLTDLVFNVGDSTTAGGSHLTGKVDELAVWGRLLSDDEIAELYNAGAGKFYPFS